jgi:hypothetical protein
MSLAGESRCNRARRHQDPQACKLVVWIPQHRRDGEIVRPRIRGDHVSRIRASREPGGWVATASVTGSYSLATR